MSRTAGYDIPRNVGGRRVKCAAGGDRIGEIITDF